MSADFRVELTVGTLPAWSIERGDPPAFPGGIDVLDGLRTGWNTPDSPFWPTQPDPTTLSFSLLAASADLLNDVDINTPVTLLIFAGVQDALGNDVPSVRFVGQVAELTGAPMRAGNQQAWRLDIQAVDTIAALNSENIAGFSVDPLTEYAGPYGWIYGYFRYCGLTPPDWNFGSNEHSTLANPMNKMPSQSLREAVEDVLSRYADGGPAGGDVLDLNNHALYGSYGWRRGILVPNINLDNVLDPVTPYAIEWVSRRSITSVGAPAEPGRLWYVGGLWTVQITPPPATTWDPFFDEETDVFDFSLAISADYLDYGATWSRSKFLDINRAVLTAVSGSDWNEPDNWNKLTRNNPDPRPVPYEKVTGQLDNVRIVPRPHAEWVGDMYVSDAYDHPKNRYEAQSFTWYASDDPQWPITRGLFPENSLTSLWRNGFSSPVLITDLPADQSPNGARFYAGTLKGVEWTFAAGGFRIGLSLFPRLPRPVRSPNETIAESEFTWLGLALLDPAPTWEDLNPADTWMDYRLVRPLGTDHPLGP